jgi:hypothetical protein
MPDWLMDVITYGQLLGVVVIFGGAYLLLLRLTHRIIYGRPPQALGPIAKLLYLAPAMTVVWLGLTYSSSAPNPSVT